MTPDSTEPSPLTRWGYTKKLAKRVFNQITTLLGGFGLAGFGAYIFDLLAKLLEIPLPGWLSPVLHDGGLMLFVYSIINAAYLDSQEMREELTATRTKLHVVTHSRVANGRFRLLERADRLGTMATAAGHTLPSGMVVVTITGAIRDWCRSTVQDIFEMYGKVGARRAAVHLHGVINTAEWVDSLGQQQVVDVVPMDFLRNFDKSLREFAGSISHDRLLPTFDGTYSTEM